MKHGGELGGLPEPGGRNKDNLNCVQFSEGKRATANKALSHRAGIVTNWSDGPDDYPLSSGWWRAIADAGMHFSGRPLNGWGGERLRRTIETPRACKR